MAELIYFHLVMTMFTAGVTIQRYKNKGDFVDDYYITAPMMALLAWPLYLGAYVCRVIHDINENI